VGAALALAVVAACGGGDDDTTTTGATQTAAQNATQTTGSGEQNGDDGYDVVISGGLDAEWKPDDGSTITCTFADDDFTVVTARGQIDGDPYTLAIEQNEFTPGTFMYETGTSSTDANVPVIQIGTSTDSSVGWTANETGLGDGAATISGGEGSPVTVALELDLSPRGGAEEVHVTALIACPAR
jgi:hypothetical protein